MYEALQLLFDVHDALSAEAPRRRDYTSYAEYSRVYDRYRSRMRKLEQLIGEIEMLVREDRKF
jgi:hypothetical protein